MPVLDPTFNVLVSEFAPARFLYTDKQYPTFEDMRADYRARGVIAVNVDYSDGTIFGAASVNWQFRAWHDMAHIAIDSPFTAEGERAAAAYQMAQVRARYGYTADSLRWCAIIDAEVNGQVEYFMQHGEFVKDQFAFAVEYIRARHGLVLPVDVAGWKDGFAVTRIQDRRAAEIAPARIADLQRAYLASNSAEARLDMLDTAAAVSELARTSRNISGHLGAISA